MKNWIKNERGFTLIEMMIVLLVITVLLVVAIPNISEQSSNINAKGCEAFVHMVQGQVQAYQIDFKQIPTFAELVEEEYLKSSETACPSGETLTINSNTGEVAVSEAASGP